MKNNIDEYSNISLDYIFVYTNNNVFTYLYISSTLQDDCFYPLNESLNNLIFTGWYFPQKFHDCNVKYGIVCIDHD